MSTSQSKLITCISEALAELAQDETEMTKLLKLNTAHFLLAKLAKSLNSDTRVNIEA